VSKLIAFLQKHFPFLEQVDDWRKVCDVVLGDSVDKVTMLTKECLEENWKKWEEILRYCIEPI
jgi:hypothetical protein